ncbi:hypothetical protein Q3V30_22215 (plasmid) [Erwinia pyri]|uniref:Uncharacterized protein n=1 Tax=Erwinia pyri TaxID=3062598 RepID=A0AA50HQA0_9GAMM|nr:hypothetical protein [Erwinia sp. DE2]WLS81172.1 hypothetical protein Q3V30_22215 [Erwinia sp. DE2]
MENSAFKRGAIAAGLWLNFSKGARAADGVCAAWALRHGLPAFIGRLPVPLACFAILSVAVVFGILIGTIVILCGIFIYMLCNITLNTAVERDNQNTAYGGMVTRGLEFIPVHRGQGLHHPELTIPKMTKIRGYPYPLIEITA